MNGIPPYVRREIARMQREGRAGVIGPPPPPLASRSERRAAARRAVKTSLADRARTDTLVGRAVPDRRSEGR